MKRVLIPILMLGACALIVMSYGWLARAGPGIVSMATFASTPSLEPTPRPIPTMPQAASPAADSARPSIGQEAPDFTLPSASGEMVTLSSYEGQMNVVLLFYRTGG